MKKHKIKIFKNNYNKKYTQDGSISSILLNYDLDQMINVMSNKLFPYFIPSKMKYNSLFYVTAYNIVV